MIIILKKSSVQKCFSLVFDWRFLKVNKVTSGLIFYQRTTLTSEVENHFGLLRDFKRIGLYSWPQRPVSKNPVNHENSLAGQIWRYLVTKWEFTDWFINSISESKILFSIFLHLNWHLFISIKFIFINFQMGQKWQPQNILIID